MSTQPTSSVNSLQLPYNSVSVAGALAMVHAGANLTALDLRGNNFPTADGAIALGRALLRHPKLVSLRLAYSDFDAANVAATNSAAAATAAATAAARAAGSKVLAAESAQVAADRKATADAAAQLLESALQLTTALQLAEFTAAHADALTVRAELVAERPGSRPATASQDVVVASVGAAAPHSDTPAAPSDDILSKLPPDDIPDSDLDPFTAELRRTEKDKALKKAIRDVQKTLSGQADAAAAVAAVAAQKADEDHAASLAAAGASMTAQHAVDVAVAVVESIRSAVQLLVELITHNTALTDLHWYGPCTIPDVLSVELALRTNTSLQTMKLALGKACLDTHSVLAPGDRSVFRSLLSVAAGSTSPAVAINFPEARLALVTDALVWGAEIEPHRSPAGAVFNACWNDRPVRVNVVVVVVVLGWVVV